MILSEPNHIVDALSRRASVIGADSGKGGGRNMKFRVSSILIVVGVAMDTVQQIESQLTMRNYESFSKKGRIRGRRG